MSNQKNSLKNEVTRLERGDNSTITYAELLKSCLNIVPEKGFTAEEMGKRLEVIKIINDTKLEEIFEFKAAEAMTVKKCVSEMRWTLLHEDILEFCEKIKEL